MKSFNLEKFCSDLVSLRGKKTQAVFAEELNMNRSTLSLLESGKQIPSLEILNKVCGLGSVQPNDYFLEDLKDGLLSLMGTLDDNDKEKIDEMMERISIKEKYEMLSRRCL
ncbi:MAG: helix-turn-helix protein [Anaerocolumna sp.]|jgi:transcriptional regulator with XRE-family HTH domain|nr:helix-turn-helix protein [Anaerocolumna sp.]